MPYRRVIGLVAGLLLSQLVLARSDLICPQHDGDGTGAAAVSVPNGAHESHHHDGDTQRQHPAPGDQSALPNCCPAMTACSASFAIQSAVGPLAFAVTQDLVIAVVGAVPPSRVETPDPPPPKA